MNYWYEQYNIQYNPHLDGNEFKKFIFLIIRKHSITVNLNFIDTSEVTDMSLLFQHAKFIGNISKWNVSNVTNMYCMFQNYDFNGDILAKLTTLHLNH